MNQKSWNSSYSYDRFGNRYRRASENQSSLPYVSVESADVDRSTNRFTTQTTGIEYDYAGNMTRDGKFRMRRYGYDANGRQVWTANLDGTNEARAVYDAMGQRVETTINGQRRVYVYDITGKIVAEYGTSDADGGGQKYIFTDNQGSTRAVLDSAGQVKARRDYGPFGEDISSAWAGRSSAQGYNSNDGTRQQYAQTERDRETGLDHTLWRKYDHLQGRWTSPDPYLGSASIADPQSLNRYSYVQNDPVNFIDPSGLLMAAPGASCYLEVSGTHWDFQDGTRITIINGTRLVCFGGGRFGAVGGGGGGSNSGGTPQNPTPNVDDNRNRIAKMLENPACRDFINDLLNGAAAMTGDPVISTNPLDLFDEVKRQRGFVYGDTIRRVYGYDGSTVFGAISTGNAQVELARPTLNIRNPQIVESQARLEAMSALHELMHLAGKKGGYSDNVLAEVISRIPGTLPPKGNISDLRKPRSASSYWNAYLEEACKLR